MDKFGASDLRRLLDDHGSPCVTLLMPTHLPGRNDQQDTLRLKNLLVEAEQTLVEHGVRAPEAHALLEPIRGLPNEPGFWDKRGSSLAIFVSETTMACYRLPIEVEETVHVNRRFLIKPLLPLVEEADRFYVLVLSQKQVHLLEGNRLSLRPVNVDNLPRDMQTALSKEAGQRSSQTHTAGRGRSGRQTMLLHGKGGERQDNKDDVLRYFRIVDGSLKDYLRESQSPLVLVGVGYLLPIYRSITSYGHILPEEVEGNFERENAVQLHRRVWPLVESWLEAKRHDALAVYQRFAGTGRTSDDPKTIVQAAYDGLVDTLFLAPDMHQWGTFRPETGDLQLSDSRQRGDDDLLDLAAVQTLLHRGNVITVPTADAASPPVAALLRY